MNVDLAPLPPVQAQAARLLELGVHERAPAAAQTLRALAADPDEQAPHALLAVRPDLLPPSVLAPLMRRGERPGFVVEDFEDVDDFAALEDVPVPDAPVYLVRHVCRGDDLAGWSPDEALPALLARGRTPLLLSEGVHLLLQAPQLLERNRCFMTIGSRLRRTGGGLDARTPALWISNGTGRDGRERRDAPKVGWCWAGNRHSWLGFASADCRSLPARVRGRVDDDAAL